MANEGALFELGMFFLLCVCAVYVYQLIPSTRPRGRICLNESDKEADRLETDYINSERVALHKTMANKGLDRITDEVTEDAI